MTERHDPAERDRALTSCFAVTILQSSIKWQTD